MHSLKGLSLIDTTGRIIRQEDYFLSATTGRTIRQEGYPLNDPRERIIAEKTTNEQELKMLC